MKLVKNLRWAAIALGILGGGTSALACVVTPDSILTEGQTLQLVADCTNAAVNPDVADDRVDTINWKMSIGTGAAETVTGDVTLAQTVAKKIYFTTPVGLTSSGTGEYTFSVSGTYIGGGIFSTADPAKVVVKPASAAVALALGVNSPTPINALCGSANGTSVQTMPTGTAQCNPGKGSLAISGPNSFTWSCLSLNGGSEANCFAYRGNMYTVTATDNGSANGNVTPTSQSVNGGQSATVNAINVTTGYNTSWTSTCGGTASGTSFTTGAVNANCTVTATFSTAPSPVNGACGSSNGTTLSAAPTTNLCSTGNVSTVTTGTTAYSWSCTGSNGGSTASCSATRTASTPAPVSSTDDPLIGGGLWVPPNMTNRTVADQSGYSTDKFSYVPGCLNGAFTSASTSGCALKSSFEGQINGVPYSATIGSGKQLVLRYKTPATLSTITKNIKARGYDGGNVGVSMRVWLSTDPTATYDSVPTACKQTSTTNPTIYTGSTTCALQPNTVYYYGIEVDAVGNYRFQVDERGADFL